MSLKIVHIPSVYLEELGQHTLSADKHVYIAIAYKVFNFNSPV